jgi:hypothetical protein
MAIFRPKPSQIFFLGLVPKSPVHTGLIYVKNPKPNISCLGPFNRYFFHQVENNCSCTFESEADWTCAVDFCEKVTQVSKHSPIDSFSAGYTLALTGLCLLFANQAGIQLILCRIQKLELSGQSRHWPFKIQMCVAFGLLTRDLCWLNPIKNHICKYRLPGKWVIYTC